MAKPKDKRRAWRNQDEPHGKKIRREKSEDEVSYVEDSEDNGSEDEHENPSIREIVETQAWQSMNALLSEEAVYKMLSDIALCESVNDGSDFWLRMLVADLADVQQRFKAWLDSPSPYKGGYDLGRPDAGEMLSFMECRSGAPALVRDPLADLRRRNDIANIQKSLSRTLMYEMMLLSAILREVGVDLIKGTVTRGARDIAKMRRAAREGNRVLKGLVKGKPALVACMRTLELP